MVSKRQKMNVQSAQNQNARKRSRAQAKGRSPTLGAIQRVVYDATKPHIIRAESRAVIAIDDSFSTQGYYLARGIYVNGSLQGFGGFDGHIGGLMSPYRWFRVAEMRFELTMTCSNTETARVTLAYNPGMALTASPGDALDNEHAVMICSGNPRATMRLTRGDITPEQERWYNAGTQLVNSQTIGSDTVKVLIPSREDCMPGSFSLITESGSASGGIAVLVVTTTLELTSYV